MLDLLNIRGNLQLFGEGADGEAAAPAGIAAGTGVTEADPQSPSGAETPAAGEKNETLTAEEEFDRLIKSDKYRDIYGRRLQNTLHQRLKGTQAAKSQLKSAQAILAAVAQKYQVDPGDFAAIQRAVEGDGSLEDDSTAAQDASENPEQEEMRREQLRQAAVRETCEDWERQGEEVKAIYPDFQMAQELENPQFQNLLRSGVDVKTAFEALHLQDIREASMAYAAKRTRENVAKSIASGSLRPSESGVSGGGAVSARSRIEAMSDDQINALCERAMRGGHITL